MRHPPVGPRNQLGVADVLVVNRFQVTSEVEFTARADPALRALAARDGFVRASLGRAADDPAYWCLVTEWKSVGAYRRALSAYDVKLYATPLLAESIEEPSAYEVLAVAEGGTVEYAASDRAADPDRPG